MLKGGVITHWSGHIYCFSFPGWLCRRLYRYKYFQITVITHILLEEKTTLFLSPYSEDQVSVVFLPVYVKQSEHCPTGLILQSRGCGRKQVESLGDLLRPRGREGAVWKLSILLGIFPEGHALLNFCGPPATHLALSTDWGIPLQRGKYNR